MAKHPDPNDRISTVSSADGHQLTVTDSGFVAAAIEGRDSSCVGTTWVKFHHVTTAAELTTVDLLKSHRVPTLAEAEAHVAVLARHWVDVDALGRRRDDALASTAGGRPVKTPWGDADTATAYARGVTQLGTSGHGGIKLSAAMNAKVPAPLRIQGGWYEEDGDWANVALAFPELFTSYEMETAVRTLKNHKPEAYEAVTGEVVPMAESMIRRQRAFEAEHADSIRVTSATMDRTNHPGMVIATARQGGRDGTGPVRTFLVPEAEYGRRSFEFIVDEVRHEELGGAPTPRM